MFSCGFVAFLYLSYGGNGEVIHHVVWKEHEQRVRGSAPSAAIREIGRAAPVWEHIRTMDKRGLFRDNVEVCLAYPASPFVAPWRHFLSSFLLREPSPRGVVNDSRH
jgi:hypothetical protein